MEIKKAEFIKSSSDISQCPETDMPEFAFIGRSNVGKSSLINALLDRKSLAKTSSTPGKTLLINHFMINKSWFLVDLPGYGYAQVSKTKREELAHMIKGYLRQRMQMYCLFVLLDLRHEPQTIDLDFMKELAVDGIPFVMVFTKADKVPVTKVTSRAEAYRKKMLEEWEALPPFFITSSVKQREGNIELMNYITKLKTAFEEQQQDQDKEF